MVENGYMYPRKDVEASERIGQRAMVEYEKAREDILLTIVRPPPRE